MSTENEHFLGRYRIVRELGEGAMGVVYEAFDPVLERRVALKTVQEDMLSTPLEEQLRTRFKREAVAAGRLHHPNIVTVFDYVEEGGQALIAMEFVEGQPLDEFVSKRGRLELAEIVPIMRGILTGLEYAHDNGIVHRDIKPANVMVAAGQVKIADFGIARLDSSDLTAVGAMLGTPGYMAPEQCQGEPVDGRADLYATGVVFYELLTGERPFVGSLTSVIQKTVSVDPVPASTLSSVATPSLDRVLARALAKRPGERFRSAAEFMQAIDVAADGLLGGAATTSSADPALAETVIAPDAATVSRDSEREDSEPDEAPTSVNPAVPPVPAVPELATTPRRQGRWGAVLGVLLALVAVGATAWWWRGQVAAPPPIDPEPIGITQTGRLDVQTVPPGVDVRAADGRLLGTTPVVVVVPAGNHDITLNKPGYHSMQVGVEVQAGDTAPLRFELRRQ